MKNKLIILTLVIVSVLALSGCKSSKNNYIVYINEVAHSIDNDQILWKEDKLFMDYVSFLDAIGVKDYGYNGVDRRLDIALGGERLLLWLDRDYAVFKKRIIPLSKPMINHNSSLYIPVDLVLEAFDFGYSYIENVLHINSIDTGRIVTPKASDTIYDVDLSFFGISLGTSAETLLNTLGEPIRFDFSPFGMEWWVYGDSNVNYVLFGVRNDKVKWIIALSEQWRYKDIGIDSTYYDLIKIMGTGSRYFFFDQKYYQDYRIDLRTLLQYDLNTHILNFYLDGEMGSVMIIEAYDNSLTYKSDMSLSQISIYEKACELQLLEMTNYFRRIRELVPLVRERRLNDVAYYHTLNMVERNFFSHTDLFGHSPDDRLDMFGINYNLSSENIAMGFLDILSSFHALITSPPHLENILHKDFSHIGIAVILDTYDHIYLTQVFVNFEQ